MLRTRFSSVFKNQTGYSRTYSDYSDLCERLTVESPKNQECFKSWLLSIFVKIFD